MPRTTSVRRGVGIMTRQVRGITEQMQKSRKSYTVLFGPIYSPFSSLNICFLFNGTSSNKLLVRSWIEMEPKQAFSPIRSGYGE